MNRSAHTPPASGRDVWSRRSFLSAAAGSMVGVNCLAATAPSLKSLDPSRAHSAKHVIFVFLVGGPSQIDTWDPKPQAGLDVRNFDGVCATAVPGVLLSENLPRLAQRMDQVALVRSLHHDGPATHAAGQQLLMTGRYFQHNISAPHWGALISQQLPHAGPLPANVVLGGRIENEYSREGSGQAASGLPAEHAPCVIDEVSSAACPSIWRQTLDLSSEAWQTRERYGFHRLGEQCLQARRLIERGARVVTVNQFSSVMDQTTWDMHANGGRLNSTAADYRETLCPQLDQALSGLLDDLAVRGLLAETVVAVCGEMGRSPRINPYGGRDHHTGVWSGLLAGGPIRPGVVIGASDVTGEVPHERPVAPAEFCATIFQALGISPNLPSVPDSASLVSTNRAVTLLDAEPIWELL